MELSELDRLEQSVKRAFEKIQFLEGERQKLASEKQELENRVKKHLTAPVRVVAPPPAISPDRLGEIKVRLNNLIDLIAEFERSL